MVTTVKSAFEEFRQNLEPTGLQKETIASRQNAVRDVVSAGLDVQEDFLTGSYARSTMIAPLSEADIDIFFVLNSKYYYQYANGLNGGQAGLLDLVKRVLKKTYTRTPDISRNGQAVTIRFEDFQVDVVPGFSRQGGGYFIADAIGQRWIETDPKKHVEMFCNANKWHNGNLVPLVKMIKRWNVNSGQFFRSFHLEVLALQILTNVTISDFPSGVRFFFGKAISLIQQINPDPAGYGGNVGAYLNTRSNMITAVSKMNLAYQEAIKAEELGKQFYATDAINQWRAIFGDYFPSYG